MKWRQDNENLDVQFSRYARGELTDEQVEALARRVGSDPDLAGAMDEYLLSLKLDGQLTQAAADKLAGRLEAESAMQEAMAGYQSLDTHLTAMGEQLPDMDFDRQRAEILAAVADRMPHRPSRVVRYALRPALAFCASAAAIVLCISVYVMFQGKPTVSPGVPGDPFEVGRVEVAVLPVEADVAGPAVVQVEMKRMPGMAHATLTNTKPVVGGSIVVSMCPKPDAPAERQVYLTIGPCGYWFGG
ncbi:MAG: hypothetical protein K8S55_01875, partial [Phycisphaerae bacterium]|nr:hypothetical protein [Phycisphaerae bacterium]